MRFEDMRVLEVHPLKGYRLLLRYADGYRLMDLSELVRQGGVLAQLKPLEAFSAARVDEFGALAWPCGIEIGPDTLYQDSLPVEGRRAEWLSKIPFEVSATGGEASRRIVIDGGPGLRETTPGDSRLSEAECPADILMEKTDFMDERNRELMAR